MKGPCETLMVRGSRWGRIDDLCGCKNIVVIHREHFTRGRDRKTLQARRSEEKVRMYATPRTLHLHASTTSALTPTEDDGPKSSNEMVLADSRR